MAKLSVLALFLLAAWAAASPLGQSHDHAVERRKLSFIKQLPPKSMFCHLGEVARARDPNTEWLMVTPQVIKASVEAASKRIEKKKKLDGFPTALNAPDGSDENPQALIGKAAFWPVKLVNGVTSVWDGGDPGPLRIKFKYSLDENRWFSVGTFLDVEYWAEGDTEWRGCNMMATWVANYKIWEEEQQQAKYNKWLEEQKQAQAEAGDQGQSNPNGQSSQG